MTKFVCVGEKPDTLTKDECVIATPDFIQDVTECRYRIPSTGVLSANYMRTLADHIGSKYDEKFPGGGRIPTSAFNGVPFQSISDIARVVVGMFKSYYPSIFDSYIEHQIKNRPFGTKLIYFVGDFLQTGPFDRNGIERLDTKDIDAFMGRKDKKTLKKSEPAKTTGLSDS